MSDRAFYIVMAVCAAVIALGAAIVVYLYRQMWKTHPLEAALRAFVSCTFALLPSFIFGTAWFYVPFGIRVPTGAGENNAVRIGEGIVGYQPPDDLRVLQALIAMIVASLALAYMIKVQPTPKREGAPA